MPRRSGVTLLEVLVAIFVMAIGMLAILTLFPIGALTMAMAIQQDCCASTGSNALALASFKNIPNEPALAFDPSQMTPDPFLNPGNLNGNTRNANIGMVDRPSYPVFIDPSGFRTVPPAGVGLPTAQTLLGGDQQNSFIARRTVSFVNTNQDAYQWFGRLDEIDFENALPATAPNGPAGFPRLVNPSPPNPMVFSRDIRYSYAFLCQRPRYADATIVDTSVVIYHKRPLAMNQNLSLAETVYPTILPVCSTVFFTQPDNTVAPPASGNTIRITYGPNTPPAVRAGDWILDASPVLSNNLVVSAHGYFYRIVGVTDLGNATEIEVETPLRGFPTVGPNTGGFAGTAIIPEGIAEVITRGPVRIP